MATKDKSGFYNVNEMLSGIYGWSVKDGKVVTPKYEFPEEFKKRIDYFGEYMGDGLTLTGALQAIFTSNDNKKAIEEFEWGGAWLPQTKETQEFIDNSFSIIHCLVAAHLLYGVGINE